MRFMQHEIVYKRVDELIPYARNARTHSAEQVAQIAASIREFGFNAPSDAAQYTGGVHGEAGDWELFFKKLSECA